MEKEVVISDESLLKKGRMTKLPTEMTEVELISWEAETSAGIREYLFSIGQPLVYKKDGQWVAEHGDGRVEHL